MTSMSRTSDSSMFRYSILSLFVAGALAVLLFHQGLGAIFYALGWTNMQPFPYGARPLFGIAGYGTIPQIWSWVFWGGVWGIVFGAVERRFPEGRCIGSWRSCSAPSS